MLPIFSSDMDFSYRHRVQTCYVAHSYPRQCVPGALPQGIKRPKREKEDYLLPSSHLVPKLHSPQVFMAWCLNRGTTLLFFKLCEWGKSRDSSVGTALGYGLDDRGSRVRFPAGAGNFSLHHRVQNGSGAYPASYPMDTRGSFRGGKAAGAWGWPPPSSTGVREWVELYLHSPHTPSWRGAQFKHRDNFYLYFANGGDSLRVHGM
jgi:hypothetical protein